MTLSPPHTDKSLRRKLALAYRRAREIGKSERSAFDNAVAVYLEEPPEEKADVRAASARVGEMIAAAVAIDPKWFWKNAQRG